MDAHDQQSRDRPAARDQRDGRAPRGRTFVDEHHQGIKLVLRTLRQHPLLVGTAEVLTDAARYIAITPVVLLLLGQFAKLAL
jgi:hypothetical protein